MRSGHFVKQPGGYQAFIPAPLPPEPPIVLDADLARLLSEADRALGRLEGVVSVIPNPDALLGMFARHEAVQSSQIDGVRCTLEEVLQFEIEPRSVGRAKEIAEVVRYIEALRYGIERLQSVPLSLRFIRDVHGRLFTEARPAGRTSGEFRRIQNWIGVKGSSLATAKFVPPPVPEMQESLTQLERFMQGLEPREGLPVLLHCGLVHVQFDTIHPFLEGNGRLARMLITFLLAERMLQGNVLYLSEYFRARRGEYYERLEAVRRQGDWEGWLRFFLRGLRTVSDSATRAAKAILALREHHRAIVSEELGRSTKGLLLLDRLYANPIVTVRFAQRALGSAYVTANGLVEKFVGLGILQETTGWRRNRRFRYDAYLSLFEPRRPLEMRAGDLELAGR